MKICQVSDIHWRSLTRHSEYTEVFNKLLSNLKESPVDIVVCTGDIFHTKTQNISPEVIRKITWMFRELVKLAPVYCILGNHDGNLSNPSREDAISPIVNAIADPNIFLFKDSQTKTITDKETGKQICFVALSPFDKDKWDGVLSEEIVSDPNVITIGLFHGSVTGCKLDNDWTLPEGEQTVNFFNLFNFAFLGDIHKQQFLGYRETRDGSEKPWIGYPGSLVQQNFGEGQSKGYYLWDIRDVDDWDVEFVEIENPYPFLTIPWKNSVDETIANAVEEHGDFKVGSRIRVTSTQPLLQSQKKQLANFVLERADCAELVFKDESNKRIKDGKNQQHQSETIKAGDVLLHKKGLRENEQALVQLYKQFIESNGLVEKLNLSPENLEEAAEYISAYLKKYNVENELINAKNWTIESLEFENLFRFGEKNKINFKNKKGIIGMFAPNMTGKTSVISSLCYALYNKPDKESLKLAEIVNRSKTEANCTAVVSLGETNEDRYKIERSLVLKGKNKDKATNSLNLKRLDKDGTENSLVQLSDVTEETRTDTDREIRKLIGTREDFMLTALSSQYAPNNFITERATNRKSILNKFLEIDIFEYLYKYVNEDVKLLDSRSQKYSKTSWTQAIQDKELELDSLKEKLSTLQAEQKDLTKKYEEWLTTNATKLNDKATLEKKKTELQKLTSQGRSLENDKERTKSTLRSWEGMVASLATRIDEISTEGPLEERIKSFRDKKLSLSQLQGKRAQQRHLTTLQEKSVAKLELVPCGTQFPDCLYIKDSHQDAKLIEESKRVLTELETVLGALEEEVSKLEAENLEKKLETKTKLLQEKQRLESLEIPKLKSELEKIQAEYQSVLSKRYGLEEELSNTEVSEEDLTAKQAEFQITLKTLESQVTKLLINEGILLEKLKQLKQEQQEAEETQTKFQVLSSIAMAFSKTGIPSLILQTQLPLINAELDNLTSCLDMKLTLETSVNSNVLDVFIENKDPKRVIELSSGAEMALASLAIRVALYRISNLSKPDFLVIDEGGFGALDEENGIKCIEFLKQLKHLYRFVLIISHIPAIKDVADSVIEIENLGNESFIEA